MAIRKMLMPVSFGSRDDKMLAFACGLSAQGIKELLVAHVVDSSGQEAPVIIAEVERARTKLLGMVEGYRSCGMSVEVRVAMGSVYEEISALAHQAHVDVVCCGTEGKSLVDYLFSGSVSEDLALRGDERTMTVRFDLLESPEHAKQVACDFGKRLVVPTDLSASAMRAFLSAFERPRQAMGRIHLVHALGDEIGDAEAQLAGLAAMATAEHGVEVVTALVEGDPAEAVLAYVDEVEATGLITGRRGRGTLTKGFLGSVSMRLMQEAPCPVVIQP
ncbi:MAG: universal stress protein [Coriobacteriia bacterium]|nr:universal stress protein [Coriobacteriia bacterium]